MQEYIEDYIALLKQDSVNTAMAYGTDLHQFGQHITQQAGENWLQVTSDQIMSYLYEQSEKSAYCQGTTVRKFASIKSFYRYLTNGHLIAYNPLESITPPRIHRVKRVPMVVNQKQVNRLMEKIDTSPLGLRNRAMLLLLVESGIHISDLVALNITDINLLDADTGSAMVTYLIRGRHTRCLTFHLSSQAWKILSVYLEQGRPRLLEATEEQALFLNRLGKRLSRQGFWFRIKSYAHLVECPVITPNLLRQSYLKLRKEERNDER